MKEATPWFFVGALVVSIMQVTGVLDAWVRLLEPVTTDHAGGWRVPMAPRVTVDQRYVMAAAGLLADDHGDAAAALLRHALVLVD